MPERYIPELDGPWGDLGRHAFETFVRETARAIVLDLRETAAVGPKASESPPGPTRSRPARRRTRRGDPAQPPPVLTQVAS